MERYASSLTAGSANELAQILETTDRAARIELFGYIPSLATGALQTCLQTLDIECASVLLKFGAFIGSYAKRRAWQPTGVDRLEYMGTTPLTTVVAAAVTRQSEPIALESIQFVLTNAKAQGCLDALLCRSYPLLEKIILGADYDAALSVLLSANIHTAVFGGVRGNPRVDPLTCAAAQAGAAKCLQLLCIGESATAYIPKAPSIGPEWAANDEARAARESFLRQLRDLTLSYGGSWRVLHPRFDTTRAQESLRMASRRGVPAMFRTFSYVLLDYALENGLIALAQAFLDAGADVLMPPDELAPPSTMRHLIERVTCPADGPEEQPRVRRSVAHALPLAADAAVEKTAASRAAVSAFDAATARAHAAAADAEEVRMLAALLEDPECLSRHCPGDLLAWRQSVLPALALRWVWERMRARDEDCARMVFTRTYSTRGPGCVSRRLPSKRHFRTVLTAALEVGDARCIRYLVSQGAALGYTGDTGDTVAAVSALCRRGAYEQVWAILAWAPRAVLMPDLASTGHQTRRPECPSRYYDDFVGDWRENGIIATPMTFDIATALDGNRFNLAESIVYGVSKGGRCPLGLLEELTRRGGGVRDLMEWFVGRTALEHARYYKDVLRWLLASTRRAYEAKVMV